MTDKGVLVHTEKGRRDYIYVSLNCLCLLNSLSDYIYVIGTGRRSSRCINTSDELHMEDGYPSSDGGDGEIHDDNVRP